MPHLIGIAVQDEAVLLRRDRRTVGEDRGKLMRYLDGSLIDPNPVDIGAGGGIIAATAPGSESRRKWSFSRA